MGFVDRMLGKEPSDEWQPARAFRPVLDLRDHSLNGIAMGDAVSSLQRIGRPDNRRPSKQGCFNYGLSGTQFGMEGGEVTYFAIALVEDLQDSLQATEAQIVAPDGRALKLSRLSTLTDVTSLIGAEPETDVDDVEIVAVYELGEYLLEVEAVLTGEIKRVNYFRH